MEDEPEVEEDRFIRLSDGDVYRYSPLLAKRKDATIVDGYAAAQSWRRMGVDNEITRKYASTAPMEPRPEPAQPPKTMRQNRNEEKAQQAEAQKQKLAARAELRRRMNAAPDEPGSPAEPETSEQPSESVSGVTFDAPDDPFAKEVKDLLAGGTH